MQAKCGGYPLVKITLLGDVTEGCDTTSSTAFIWWAAVFEAILLVILSVAQCARLQGLMVSAERREGHAGWGGVGGGSPASCQLTL